MGKTKDLSAFERGLVIGARRTGLNVSRTATLLCFSPSTVSPVYQEWSITQRTSSQLDTALESTWAIIPVVRFRHVVESMPQQIEAVLMAKGGATQY
uniref:Tc3 transposase DNA binding domain-containing protein n=1 Tax=Oncorhynchus mykiss TaxID=8022 RepID=A0A8K9VDC5_ONCMY